MSNIPKLTEKQVERFIGSRSFSSRRAFARGGGIDNARLDGSCLKAQFEGSMPYPYRTEVQLGPNGIVSSECNCNNHKYGACKHVAAVLFTWLERPDTFRVVQSIDGMLAELDRDGLIALIHKMLERAPELEALFELPLPGMSKTALIDANTIRTQVARALSCTPRHEWRASSVVARELETLLDTADEYLEAGAWQNAMIIFEVMARDVLEEYYSFNDHEGEFHGIIESCVEGLGKCLNGFSESEQALRLQIMRCLFDIRMWDINFGGIDMGVDAPEVILREATEAEKEQVAVWAEGPSVTDDEWGREYLDGFALDLLAHKMDDESYLDYCRKAGRKKDLIKRLLQLNRVEEAINEARNATEHTLITLNDLFTAHNQPNLVEQIARERLSENPNRILLEWLKELAQTRGNQEEVLQCSLQLFSRRPSLEGYTEVKKAAVQVGTWATLRSNLITRLTEAKKYDLLTHIHLAENENQEALNTLQKTGRNWGSSALATKVARAAENTHPQDALKIYHHQAYQLIANRGRSNYATAAVHLTRMRDIYLKMGDKAAWGRVIGRVRADHPRLSALKDELRKAGL